MANQIDSRASAEITTFADVVHATHRNVANRSRLEPLVIIDEAWYLEQNPDIAEVVRRGEYESAQAHFDGPGYREGRLPFPVE